MSQWPKVILVVAGLGAFTTLAVLGYVPRDIVAAAVGGVLGWLLPSPLRPTPPPSP